MEHRVLVTGGAGLVGSHLCERLVAGGDRVVCMDNFSSGAEANVAHLTAHPRFELVRQDVEHPFRLAVDRIYHLACPAASPPARRDPVQVLRTCFLGTMHALELARRTGARMLLASGAEVYGDPAVHPQPETYAGNVVSAGPRACIEEGKRAAETLCFDFARQHGTRVKVARLFDTYGPRMRVDDARPVAVFAVQALRGEPVTVPGDGAASRSFCYVTDAADALMRLMEAPLSFVGPVNLGSGAETTLADLARRIIDLCGSSSALACGTDAPDEPRRLCPDLDLAMSKLHWSAGTALDAGLQRTIAYFRRTLGIPQPQTVLPVAAAQRPPGRRGPKSRPRARPATEAGPEA